MALKFYKTLGLLLILLFGFLGSAELALAQVTETVTISAEVGTITPPSPPGSSGGGGVFLPQTAVRFTGEAYPGATIHVLKNGEIATSVPADSKGLFSATLAEEYESTVLYTLYAVDISGERSLLINYPLAVYTGFVTHLSGIRFAPTIVADKAQVKFGDYLEIFGYSLPSKALEAAITSPRGEEVFSLDSRADGFYRAVLPLAGFPRGDYTIHVQYPDDARKSKLLRFTIADVNIPSAELVVNIPGDCNSDKVINLTDFSVLAFWYGKNNPPKCVDTNSDNKIDLVDFSILAFWWTG